MELAGFLQQHALYLLAMVIIQIILATAAHWATRERGLDDTWVGAIGLTIVFGAPPVALWLAGLDARVLATMFQQSVVVVSMVKFTEWAKRRAVVAVALFVLRTLNCLIPPGLLAVWLVLARVRAPAAPRPGRSRARRGPSGSFRNNSAPFESSGWVFVRARRVR